MIPAVIVAVLIVTAVAIFTAEARRLLRRPAAGRHHPENLPGPAANRDSGSRGPGRVGADSRAGEPGLARYLNLPIRTAPPTPAEVAASQPSAAFTAEWERQFRHGDAPPWPEADEPLEPLPTMVATGPLPRVGTSLARQHVWQPRNLPGLVVPEHPAEPADAAGQVPDQAGEPPIEATRLITRAERITEAVHALYDDADAQMWDYLRHQGWPPGPARGRELVSAA